MSLVTSPVASYIYVATAIIATLQSEKISTLHMYVHSQVLWLLDKGIESHAITILVQIFGGGNIGTLIKFWWLPVNSPFFENFNFPFKNY